MKHIACFSRTLGLVTASGLIRFSDAFESASSSSTIVGGRTTCRTPAHGVGSLLGKRRGSPFTPIPPYQRRSWRTNEGHVSLLWGSQSTDPSEEAAEDPGDAKREQEPTSVTNGNLKKLTARRAGGRSIRPSSRESESNPTSKVGKWAVLAIPFLIVMVIWKLLFGGSPADSGTSGYMFYQSSVYETRVVGSDGKVERTRKESVRSNIPNLMERKSRIDGSSSSSYSSIQTPGEDFDRELRMLMRRAQKAVLDDSF
jgi:hypothetical protein